MFRFFFSFYTAAVPSSPAPVRRSTGSSFMRPTASSVAKDKDMLSPVLVKSSIRPAATTSIAQRPLIRWATLFHSDHYRTTKTIAHADVHEFRAFCFLYIDAAFLIKKGKKNFNNFVCKTKPVTIICCCDDSLSSNHEMFETKKSTMSIDFHVFVLCE